MPSRGFRDVGRLALIQKEVGRGRVVVLAARRSRKPSATSVSKKIARRTRMQTEAALDGCESSGCLASS